VEATAGDPDLDAARARAAALVERWRAVERAHDLSPPAGISAGVEEYAEAEGLAARGDGAAAAQGFEAASAAIAEGLTRLALDFRAPEGWTVLDSTPGEGSWARKVLDPDSGICFLLVDSGTFSMGAPDGQGEESEHPRHEVRITRAFYLARTETTVGQWRRFVERRAEAGTPVADESGGWVMDRFAPSAGEGGEEEFRVPWVQRPDAGWSDPNPLHQYEWSDAHPVTHVSWHAASSFCEEYGYRLPTEAEWEYAARAGTTTRFWWGDREMDGAGRINLRGIEFSRRMFGHEWGDFDDGHAFTAPVASFEPNPWGFHDILGNVWEWCADSHSETAYRAEGRVDPLVSETVTLARVMRGGSWSNPPHFCRAAYRAKLSETDRASHGGFRAAFSP
jgi:formylglycine-generating enzyme required for sulfatase activity